ncbi:hypothetical protein Syun_006418 [Stephania yunnanensis]|uniref:Uncharacterized protein n=1 Tax=Stephania yunnanensis TaxID=152371 RepID=A0AAP0KWI0_9MAGN
MQNREGERNPGRERDEEEEQNREGSVLRLVVCDLVNVRSKVVISSFTYNGLANPTKMVVLFNPLPCLLTNPLA